jgi:signal transduction histidine kinase
MLRRLLAACLCLLALAQAARGQQALLEPYQEDVGLTTLTATCLTQDRRGVLWICTANGLYRFDGFHAEREALPRSAGQDMQAALADRWGRLWVATEGGLYWRRIEDATSPWMPVPAPGTQRALSIDAGHRLDVDDRGTLYAIDRSHRVWAVDAAPAGSSPARIRPLELPPHEPGVDTGDTRSGPLLVSGDSLWFGCGTGLCQWRERQLRRWGAADGLPAQAWATLVRGHDGTIWARSSELLARRSPGMQRFEAVNAPRADKWPGSIALAEDPRGAILTASDDGVARWDGRHWRVWTEREGMPQTMVRTLLFDADGELWLGASGRGLYRWIGYGQVDHWTPAQGLPSAVVSALARDGAGRLWAGTVNGAAVLDAGTRRFSAVALPTVHGPVYAMARDSAGTVWWVQRGRLLRVRRSDALPQVVAADPAMINVSQDGDTVYLLCSDKVQRIEPRDAAGVSLRLVARVPADGPSLIDVRHDAAGLWLIGDDSAWRVDASGHWRTLHDTAGRRVDTLVPPAFVSPSDFWAVDFDGLAEYHLDHGTAAPLRRFAAASFGDPTPIFLNASPDGRLWYGTDHGLFVLDHGQWRHFDRSNGLLWNDLDTQGFLLDADGSVWLGSSAGLTHWRPRRTPPQPVRLRLDAWRVGPQALASAPAQPIPWAQRRLLLTLGTPDLARGRSLHLEYRLDDDHSWHASAGNELTLEALDAGRHRLTVREAAPLAADTDTDADAALSIAFEVLPAWYAQPAARIAFLLALALLWWGSMRWLNRRSAERRRALERAIAERTAELEASREALRDLGAHNARALEEERKRVARELHDELGQQLAALRMEMSVLRIQTQGNGDATPQPWNGLLQRVDHLMSSMRSVVTRLRPPALDGGLAPAIDWLAREFTRDTGVPCRTEIAPEVRSLPPDIATMVFRIAQESLNNVRRHAQAQHAALTLRRERDDWLLTVTDDGQGFDPAAPRAGYGLLGMEERARLLGGTLQIDSTPGRGTTLRLRVREPARQASDSGSP